MFVGIDLGTGGIRILAGSTRGDLLCSVHQPFDPKRLHERCDQSSPDFHEQDPRHWEESLTQASRAFVTRLAEDGLPAGEITGICTTSTSGTVLAVDQRGRPLSVALMYDDNRARVEAENVSQFAVDFSQKLGYVFKPSFALPKILWMKSHWSDRFKAARKIVHANDFLVGCLSGNYAYSDSSNCLKTGFDFLGNQWPDFIERDLSIPLEKLPIVKAPGTRLTTTSEAFERETGFPAGIPVVAGATDSTMALVASGASRVGDIFSSLGTTLVTRLLTPKLVKDPKGRVYCHTLPGREQIFLPGGASSVGAGCLPHFFPEIDYAEYDTKALEYFPTPALTYPLVRRGERFPVACPDAEHFYIGPEHPCNKYERYTAYLQGVGFVERLSIDLLTELAKAGGTTAGDIVYTIGGGSRSAQWLQVRADILQKTLSRPAIIEAAWGAAIVAAAALEFQNDLHAASARMIHPDLLIIPRAEHRERIENLYAIFTKKTSETYNIDLSFSD